MPNFAAGDVALGFTATRSLALGAQCDSPLTRLAFVSAPVLVVGASLLPLAAVCASEIALLNRPDRPGSLPADFGWSALRFRSCWHF